jgi:hypothetical protein
MTDHPITPPDELVRQWATTNGTAYEDLSALCQNVATQAARWGADQELEACCELASQFNYDDYRYQDELRAARRPKPPSLKELALKALKHAPGPNYPNPITLLTAGEHALIRRALESLPD